MFGCRYFSLQHFEDILLFPPACKVSAGKSPDRFLRFPSCIPFSFLILPFRWKEGKKNATCQHIHSQRQFLQIPIPLAHALKLIKKSPSHITQALLKVLVLRVNEINSRVLVSCSTQLPQI